MMDRQIITTKRIVCLSLLVHFCTSAAVSDGLNGRKVLMVSMDGFRYDYFQKANLPNFKAFMTSGVQVPYVNNTFVTLTFPSHTSIVTGLYEESHGIVANSFYDPLYQSNFSMRSLESKWWNASEPIWINAVKAGLKVGTFFWPGSTVDHEGRKPTIYREYDSRVPFEERVDTVVNWLSHDNFDFVILYFNEPDHSGHAFGPDDPRLVPVIERMDSVLGRLMRSLEEASLKDSVDVIVTSDHGMTEIDLINKLVDITEHVNDTLLDWSIPSWGSSLNLMAQPGKSHQLAQALDKIEHIHAYVKEDIPEHFHYQDNRRIMPVFVYADEGWMLSTERKATANIDIHGSHGFDNALMSMKPIFVASGPSFKSGYRLPEPIESVDTYPLLCHLLKLTPAPNNGSLDRVKPLLRMSNIAMTTTTVRVPTTSSQSKDGASIFSSSLTLCFACLLLSIFRNTCILS